MKLQGLSPPRDETTSPDDELFSLETESPVDAGFLYATLGDREERIPVLPVRERIELVAQIQRLAKGKCDWVEEYPRLTQPRSAPTAEATRAAVAKESDDSEPRGLSNALKKALGSIEPRASGSALPSAQQCIAWLLAVVATSTYRFEATQVLYLGQLVLLYRTYLGNAFAAASLPTAVILDLFERGEAYLREPAREHFLPQLLSARSEILLQLDRRQEAIAAAEEAVAVKERHPISVGPRLASYWLNLGNLLVQDNRGTEAEPLWKKVLLDPNASPQHRQTAQAQLALLLEERGDLGASPQRL